MGHVALDVSGRVRGAAAPKKPEEPEAEAPQPPYGEIIKEEPVEEEVAVHAPKKGKGKAKAKAKAEPEAAPEAEAPDDPEEESEEDVEDVTPRASQKGKGARGGVAGLKSLLRK